MRLLIADDHPVVLSGLRRLVQSDPDAEIIEASTGTEVLNEFRKERPDIVVLDINLPDIGGLELLRRLTAADPQVRILVFSMHGEPIYARQALRAGALGYVTKTAPPEEILTAISRVAAGAPYIENELATELALDGVRRREGEDPMIPLLDSRELELLRLVGAGRSLKEMAAATGVTYKTIANRMTLLKSRLNVSTTSELVRLALKSGLSR